VRTASPLPDIDSREPSGQTRSDSLDWLDALKGIAIVAVVLDHAFIVDNFLLWKHLYFSVSWFIFLAGVSNAYSARRRGYDPARDTFSLWKRRLRSLLLPYLFVSVMAGLFFDRGAAPVSKFVRDLLLFHGLPPLYFIVLLIQLLALFPVLYWALHRAGWIGRCLVAVAIVPVAAVLSHEITFPWVLGAHYLFGASFLYLFVLGMIAEGFLSSQSMHPVGWLAAGLIVFVPAERINVATNGVLMTHPPSNVLVAYSVGLLAIAYACARLFPETFPVRLARRLGRRSIDIFLYHYFFLIPFFPFRSIPWTRAVPFVWSQVLVMLCSVPLAIGGSLLAARLAALCGTATVAAARRVSQSLRERGAHYPDPPGVNQERSGLPPILQMVRPDRGSNLALMRLVDADRPTRRRRHQ
jgi:peptidoglycan/LPS O-acetylase OafA/YrhL